MELVVAPVGVLYDRAAESSPPRRVAFIAAVALVTAIIGAVPLLGQRTMVPTTSAEH